MSCTYPPHHRIKKKEIAGKENQNRIKECPLELYRAKATLKFISYQDFLEMLNRLELLGPSAGSEFRSGAISSCRPESLPEE